MLDKEQARPLCSAGEVGKEMKRYLYLLLFLFVSACVTSSDFELLRQDVNNLKRDSYDIRKDMDSLKEKTANTVKEDSFSALRESQSETTSRLSEISKNIQELTGRFEENKYFFEKTLKDSSAEKNLLRTQIASIETEVKLLRDRLASLEGHLKTMEPPKETAGTSTAPAASAEKEEQAVEKKDTVDDKTRAYETAYQTFKSRKYKEAREKFEAFIKNHPKSDLTDNAQFWIAEAYNAEKDYEGAILAYETLLKKYPSSDKTGGALLKQGFAFIELGDKKTAKIILEKLIEKFPDSREAELAKKKIADIGKKSGSKK